MANSNDISDDLMTPLTLGGGNQRILRKPMTKAGDRKEELMTPLTLGTPNQPLRKASMMSQG